MKLHQFGSFLAHLYPSRWLASILLLFLVDVATWLAFSKTSGRSVVENQDKIMHMVGFFGLFIMGHVSLHFDFFPRVQRQKYWLLVLNAIIWLAYGVFIELVQKYLSYRSFSIGDLIADGLGILLGAAFVVTVQLYPRSIEPHGQT